MSSAHVLSIQALEELKGGLKRFGTETQDALNAAAIEIQRTLDWLQGRLTYWRNEANRRQEALNRAHAALERCRSTVYVDPRTGHARHLPCTVEQEAVYRARVYLEEAQAELRNVREWTRLIQQAADDYQRQAQRLTAWLDGQLPGANAFLERKITTLQSYVMMGVPVSRFTTTPPTQAVGETFATAVGLAALDTGLSAAAVAVIRWLASDVRHVLGSVGEELAAQLIREQPDFQELPFDQPKHGFDRVFAARNLPLIVMESKVTSNGAFHIGQTQHGEQGSPEWIAAQAQKMADRTSAQWSPLNERIAAMVRILGPENIPSVAVVIQSATGQADIYVRPVRSDAWQPLREGVSLADTLAGTPVASAHPETRGGVESERGPESIEGAFSGPKRG